MEWISIKDGLPEPGVDILAACINRTGWTLKKGESYHAIDRWIAWNDGFHPSFRTDRFDGTVTHWMPLPNLPDHFRAATEKVKPSEHN